MRNVVRFIATIALLAVAGCNQSIQVVDQSGSPIQGASIVPQSLSINGGPILTNAQGRVDVPSHLSLQQTVWVWVSKPGFQTEQITVHPEWPAKIVLTVAKAP